MKSKSTIVWFMLAVALAAAIWALNRYAQPGSPAAQRLMAGLRADQVANIQIIPAGAHAISVTRTNHGWLLEKPLVYPAQAAAIDGLLAALERLTPVVSFSPGEMSAHKNADAEFGFDKPQFTLDITAGDQVWHLVVGYNTAPGDGVYLRLVGTAGAFVTDPTWLQFLPHDVSDWRDTTLADVPDTLDWLVVTNGNQAIELRRDATNRLWHMVRPLQARANNLRIATAAQQLRTAHVSRFINDDPKADLTAYGLDPAALDIWMGAGTNLGAGLHAGKDVAGVTGEVYARREGWNTVVATAKEPLAPWRGGVNDFRDPSLLELTGPVTEVEVRGPETFTFQRRGTNGWTEAGEKFPVDSLQVNRFIDILAHIQIADFVQDVVTASGLQGFGLATPSQTITVHCAGAGTNTTTIPVLFGATTTNNEIYVKRGDEDFVYAVSMKGLDELKVPGEFFRDHRIWNFSETNVALVTLRQNGKMRQMLRTGANEWSLAAGSQGIINPPAVEESIHMLGQLSAMAWLSRKNVENIGLTTNSLSVTVELKSGEKYSVQFGEKVRVGQDDTALAVVTLDGESWPFIFPPALCLVVAENLIIPPDAP